MTKQEDQVFLNILHEYRDDIQYLNNDLEDPELHSLLESYQLLNESKEEKDTKHKKGHGDRSKRIKLKIQKINIKIKDLEKKKKEKEIALKTKTKQLQIATKAIQSDGKKGQGSIEINGNRYVLADLQKEIGTLNQELYGESVTPFLDVKEKMYLEFIMSLKEPLFKSNLNQLDETCNRFIEVIKYVELNEGKDTIQKLKNKLNDPATNENEKNNIKSQIERLEKKQGNKEDPKDEPTNALVKAEPKENPKDEPEAEEPSSKGSITDRLEDLYDKRSELKDELGNSPSAKKDFTNFLMKKGGSIMSTLGKGLQAVVGAVLFKAIFNP